MKTRILFSAVTLAAIVAVGAKAYKAQESGAISDIMLENIEALSEGEDTDVTIPCRVKALKTCTFEVEDADGNLYDMSIGDMEKVK